jgi:ACS family glucarate transporter-like MFS transporter
MMFAITGLGGLLWLPGWLSAAPSDATPARHQADNALGNVASPPASFWHAVLTNRTFWALLLSIFLSSYYWYFVLTWVPSYLILARGFSTLGMGRVVSTALFTMAVVNVLAGLAVDRVAARMGVFQARLCFGVAGYLGTAAILLLLVVPNRWALAILTFSMCATGIGNSNFWAISQHVPPKHLVGRTIGYLNTVAVMAGALAPLITGWILGPQKQFGPAILIAGVCCALAGVCLLTSGARGLERLKALLAADSYVDASL